MAQSLAKILLHLVFSTKERRPFLRDQTVREELHRYMGGTLANIQCQPVIIGGVADHVHVLCTLSRTITVADMVRELKKSSAVWLKDQGGDYADFSWQNGYGIFSIGFSQLDAVRNYIAGQEEHHKKATFQEEFRALLRRYELTFDEAYVWD